jgi:hypothetical protein
VGSAASTCRCHVNVSSDSQLVAANDGYDRYPERPERREHHPKQPACRSAATAATPIELHAGKCAPSFSHFSSRQQAKTAARDSSQQPPTKSLSRSMQEFKKAEELTSQHVHVTPIEPF